LVARTPWSHFSEPVHLFCIELMPDFHPTSEVIWLSLSLNQTFLPLTMILILPTEHSACPSSQGDCLQCSRPNLSIGI
jgi:hypothetical protein